MVSIVLVMFSASLASGGLLDDDPFFADEDGPVWARGGETLLYEVSFIGIAAGYAELSYVGVENEGWRKVFRLRAKLWTTGLVKFFKEINEEYDYYVDSESLLPHKIIVTKNKSHGVEKKVVYYDQEKGLLRHFTLEGEKIKEFQAVPGVFEPMTVAYYLRTLDLSQEPGIQHVYGGRKVVTLEVKLLGNEKVKTDVGVFDTLKIKPIMKYKGEVMEDREVAAWVINDGSNIPLLVHAKLRGLTVTGELIKMDTWR